LLPDLEPAQALEVTAIHSVLGALPKSGALIVRPPFVVPHHGASMPAIVGDGSGFIRPGAISKAHHGILFLDDTSDEGVQIVQAYVVTEELRALLSLGRDRPRAPPHPNPAGQLLPACRRHRGAPRGQHDRGLMASGRSRHPHWLLQHPIRGLQPPGTA